MVSERDGILAEIVPGPPNPEAKLEAAMSEAERTKQLSLEHDYAIKIKRADLGWFGVIFGSEAHASIVVAFVVVIMGFGTAIALWTVAYFTGRPEFWSSEAHVALAAATSALGYVFGRGSKDAPGK